MNARIGVLLMAYGTPRSLDEVEAYYTHIRHGRKPTPELLADLLRRYQAIGGVSPLNEITQAQAQALQRQLDADGKVEAQVYLGYKHTQPFLANVTGRMVEDGIRDAVAIVLAPHYSRLSIETYLQDVKQAAADTPLTVHAIRSWHLHPGFIQLLSARVSEALAKTVHPESAVVIFSAHSLPKKILEWGDPYPEQLRQTGEAVAQRLHLKQPVYAWQSAGRTQDEWLGPDILEVLRQLARAGAREVVICPAGFVSEHLEILYDIDIECQQLADELGIRLVRTAALNDDPAFIRVLADLVYRRGSESGRAEK
ncbi:ferrochelatase [Alicyclobacillus shizuokensis]|uniref:ferrochelatase n=1 Tax=Alicyclobacillus shizuokensis TaxID=392014 RepID=UPI00082EE122|nr:ferrochelatase [Alicyclobacillus shizuokensis]